MIQAMIAKKLIEFTLKKVLERREIKNMRKYVEEDNELDIKVKDLHKRMKELETVSHAPAEFVCMQCGCKGKRINKRRRK
jgi:hypothetical protein